MRGCRRGLLAQRNSPFGGAKQAVRHGKARRFALQGGYRRKELWARRLRQAARAENNLT